MKIRRIIAAALLISTASATAVFADYSDVPAGSYYYGNVTRNTEAISGAVSVTPEQYKFSVGGQEFILLDFAKKNGKTYFFVMTESLYGTHKYSTATAEPYGWFNPEDTNNVAYWLNNDFFDSGNGGKTLPDAMKPYITEWEWKTEALRDDAGSGHVPEGYKSPSVPPVANCKIALVSSWEWKKYIGRIGYPGATWIFRTARTVDIKTNTKTIICHTGGLGYNATVDATGTPRGIRPVFFIDSDFFANCKIESAGGEVAKAIDEFCNPELYTETEKATIFGLPDANITSVTGNAVIGQELEVNYIYSGAFDEQNTKIQWLRSNESGTAYTEIAGADKKKYTVTNADSDRFLKVTVTPGCSSKMVPVGAMTESNPLGPVIGIAAVNQYISEIKNADADTVLSVLESYNTVFDIDTDLSFLGDAAVAANVRTIFANADFSTIEEVRTEYARAVALARLNANSDVAQTGNYIVSDLALNLSRFNNLQDEDKNKVYKAVANKNYSVFTAFQKDFYEAVCLSEINKADRNNIKEILLANKEILGADFSGISEYQLGLVGTDILSKSYADFAEIKAQLAIAIPKAKSNTEVPDSPMISEIEEKTVKDSSHGAGFVPYIQQNTVVYEAQNGNFTDMDQAEWARIGVEALTQKGIVAGYGDGTFCPNALLTREEFVKIVVSAFYPDKQGFKESSGFTDVKADGWYSMYINIAVNNKIISGISEKEFGIGKPITREDMAVIICRIIGISDEQTDNSFADNEQISDYARDAVGYLSSKKIINGFENGNFEPKTPATRAMAAKIVYDILVQEGKI